MGKRQVHVVTLRKPVTFGLLLLITVLMAGLLFALSGKAYVADRNPMMELTARVLGIGSAPISRSAVLAFLMPVTAHALLFVPWGFLAFVALDSPKRGRFKTYAMTVLGALVVAAAVYVWQEFLPTRVTSPGDAIANAAGAFAGAALGHMRKRVHIRFDY